MPIIQESSYIKRPWFFFNGYLETIIPHLTTKIYQVDYEEERLDLVDGDFLDLFWIRKGHKNLMIISHAIEGNVHDIFVEKTAEHFSNLGFDILAWNFRSCSREPNRLPRFYHHGDIDDLESVIEHSQKASAYERVVLVGFSMGGNLLINYLGNKKINHRITCSIVFSVPLDLKLVARKLGRGFNTNFEKKILGKWKRKIRRKAEAFPEEFDTTALDKISSLEELHETHTLALSGFGSLDEYYMKWSSLQFLEAIETPLLIVNAKNDPLLSEKCYPYEICQKSKSVYLETPNYGGHTGFTKKYDGILWYLKRIEDFIQTTH